MTKVTIYVAQDSPNSWVTKRYFEACGVELELLDAGADIALWRKMWEITGREDLPQVFIDGRHLGGFPEFARLVRTGEIDEVLNQKEAA